MNVLILGYGSAGQRHARTFSALGCQVGVFDLDPDRHGQAAIDGYAILPALDAGLAIVCTPPAEHIRNIKHCLDRGMTVICEKPLCGLGEYPEAVRRLAGHPHVERLSFTFNYRWHEQFLALRTQVDPDDPTGWSFISDQHRPSIPDWGLLVDHLPHTLDLMLWLAGTDKVLIHAAQHKVTGYDQTWTVAGEIGARPFHIWDSVRSAQQCHKISEVKGPFGYAMLEQDGQMFVRMAEDMLEFARGIRPAPVSLEEALKVQQLLERIAQVEEERK